MAHAPTEKKILPAQRLEALRATFRALEQDVNKLLGADRSDFDSTTLDDALSVAEDAIATLAVEANTYFDHVDELHAARAWAA